MRRALLLAAATGCFVTSVLLYPAAAADGPGSGFYGYDLRAQSAALRFTEDEPSANSHPEAEGDVPQSQVSLASGVGYGLSSVAWPGALVGNAGSLVLLVSPGAPSQVTALNDPVRAEARSGSAQHTATNDSVPGARMTADATLARTSADAKVDGGSAGATVGFGTSSSSSVATLGARTAKVTADSTAKDVTLAGVVRIGSVVSHAEASTDGTTATAKGKTTVTGMTVAGIPVVVDDQGVTVDTAHGAVPPTAVATVNSALASLGMTITLSAATSQRSGGTISYDAGSLLVFWKTPGYPSTVTASFGGSHVVAGASASSPLVLPPLPSGAPPVVSVPSAAPVPVAPGGGLPQLGGTGGAVPPVVPGPSTAPAAPLAQTALEPLASGSPAPTWSVLLAVVGGLLALGGLWRVPGLVLVEPRPVRCPLEEDRDD